MSDAPEGEELTEWELELGRVIEETNRAWWGPPFEPDVLNGAVRAFDGTFSMLGHRQFRADGRYRVAPDAFYDLLRRIAFLEARATGIDPTTALTTIAVMRRCVDRLEHEAIAIARGFGWSWRSIGQVLGVDAAALHRRFAKPEIVRRKRPKRGKPASER